MCKTFSHPPLASPLATALSSWIRLGVRDSKQFILLPPSTPLPAAKILPVPHAHLSQYLCPKVRKVGQKEPCRVVGRSECHGRRLAPAKQDVRRSGRRGGGSGCRRPAARIATPVRYLDAEHPSTVLHNCFAADPFSFFLTHPTPARRVIPDKVRTCLKCRVAPSQVIVRSGGTHGYCSACFLLMVTHKFRALIGKQRVIQRDERVSVHPHLCYNSMLFDIPCFNPLCALASLCSFLHGRYLPSVGQVLLAYSGGAASAVLLHLAHHVSSNF